MMPMITHSKPYVGIAEAKAVASVVQSGQLAQGEKVEQLEQDWAKLVSKPQAVALCSGTAALTLALISLGLKAGDQVLVPAYGCLALVNACLAAGVEPVLVDVEPDRWTINPVQVFIYQRPKVKAVIVVDTFGVPAKIEQIQLPVIRDISHGFRPGQVSGGRLSVCSLYATKMICAGMGGILAGPAELIEGVRGVRDGRTGTEPSPWSRHEQMTDLQAALALVQLDKLEQMLTKREQIAGWYDQALAPLQQEHLLLPIREPGRVWYRYVVRLQQVAAADVAEGLQRIGIMATRPVDDLRGSLLWRDTLDVSSQAYRSLLSLPLYPSLDEAAVDQVVWALRRIFER